MRKYPGRRKTSIVGALALAASLLGACTSDKSDDVTVEIKGGKADTYRLDDQLTVTAAPKSVLSDAKLTLKAPRRENMFRGLAAVRFDLSLNGGEIQPNEPLDLAIDLKGGYLPEGMDPSHALLYTPSATRNGLVIIPATVKDGVLHAKLKSLSPKLLAFPTDNDLIEMIGRWGDPQALKSPCPTSATVKGGTLHFSGANKGWTNKPSSPVQACLPKKGTAAELNVTNRVNTMLAVAAHDDLKLSVDGNSEDEQAAVRLARQLYPSKKIKQYVGREATIKAPLVGNSLPAVVELQAEPSVFLSQMGWSAFKFLVGVLSGDKDKRLLEVANQMLDVPAIFDCVKGALSGRFTNNPSLRDVMEAVTSACADKVGKQLGMYSTYDKGAWKDLWDRFFVVADGLKTAWDTVWMTASAIKMQFNGTVRVVVDVKELTPACPSDASLLAEVRKSPTWGSAVRVKVRHDMSNDKVCEGSWAVARVHEYWTAQKTWGDPAPVLFRYRNGRWSYVATGAPAGFSLSEDADMCAQLPSQVKEAACVDS